MGYLSIKKYPGTGEQAFLDADHTKLNGIETSATIDQTGAEIVTLLEALGVGSRLSHTKLDDISASDHHAKYTDAEALTQAKANIEDAPVNGHTEQGISSNWAFDHAAAADPHTGYVLETLFDAYSLLYADTDNIPARLTVAASRFVGRKAAGGIAAMTAAEAKTLLAIGITDISDIPGTIASILTDHDKTTHDALGIAPASHGANKHTDVSRRLFIPAQYADGDGTVQRYVGLPDGVQKTETFLFKVPDDYVSGASLKFKYVDCALSSGDVVWSMYKWHFSVNEGITSNSSSDTNNVRAVAQGSSLRSVFVSVSLTGLVKADYISLEFRREGAHASDTLANDFTLAGILFSYMAEQ